MMYSIQLLMNLPYTAFSLAMHNLFQKLILQNIF